MTTFLVSIESPATFTVYHDVDLELIFHWLTESSFQTRKSVLDRFPHHPAPWTCLAKNLSKFAIMNQVHYQVTPIEQQEKSLATLPKDSCKLSLNSFYSRIPQLYLHHEVVKTRLSLSKRSSPIFTLYQLLLSFQEKRVGEFFDPDRKRKARSIKFIQTVFRTFLDTNITSKMH